MNVDDNQPHTDEPAVDEGPAEPEPADEPAPDLAPAGDDPPTRRTNRRRLAWVTGGVGVFILLVAGVTVARTVINDNLYSPSKPVEQYLAALSAGDAAGATRLAEPDVPQADRKLMTNAVYGKATDRPGHVEVTDVERDGDIATVTVRYDQGGAKVTQMFTVHRAGSRNVVFDKWVMEPAEIATVDLGRDQLLGAFYVSSVLVNGVEIEYPVAYRSSLSLRLLPGTYTIALPDGGEYAQANTVTITVEGAKDPQGLGDLRLLYEYTDAAKDEAQRRTEKWLAACMKPLTTGLSDDCPFWGWDYGGKLTKGTARTIVEPEMDTDVLRRGALCVRGAGGYVELTAVQVATGEPWVEKRSMYFVKCFQMKDGELAE